METTDSIFSSAMEYLRRQCATREYCCKDVRAKALKRFNAAPQTSADAGDLADKAVRSLIDEGFVSEQRYACAYVRDKSSLAGWGAAKIRYMLLGKGIPRETVCQALDRIDPSIPKEKLTRALETKYRAIAPGSRTDECRQKLLRFALSRGYGYEDSIETITNIINTYQNESQ